jgi:acyl-CoA synthetase (AMP-forming)/AMP-acid ligase II
VADDSEAGMAGAWREISTAGDLLVRAAQRWPDADALVVPGCRLSFAELRDRAISRARSLLGLGIRPGERVGVLMPNCAAYVEALFGCALIGAPVLTINARFKEHELAHVLADARPSALLTTDLVSDHADFVALLGEVLPKIDAGPRVLAMLGDDSPEGFVDRALFDAAAYVVDPDAVHRARSAVRLSDEAVMLYTSGTTAMPKGCPLSHEAIVRTAMAAAERWELTAVDRFWDPLPLYHIGGIFPLLAMVHRGAAFVTQTHFAPDAAIGLLESERITFAYPTFPTITRNLVRHPRFAGADLSAVRLVLDTGSPDDLRETQQHFPYAAVITLYGLTEAGGGVAFGHLDEPLGHRVTSAGRPLHGVAVRIVDPDTGEGVPAGTRGEILVRGPGVFGGYHDAPEATAAVLRDGWLHTGDLGALDADGRLTYVARLKDMLKVGGENVAAVEIEAFLAAHPAVNIAQVVGVPNEHYGEVPAAFVEPRPGHDLSGEELVDWCRGRIASFKVPRHVRVVSSWPMSSSKIQKYRLRADLIAELDAEGALGAGGRA